MNNPKVKFIKLKNGTIKSHLCHYSPIDDNFLKNIKDNCLWFSSPLSFNDPYDCNLEINIKSQSFEEAKQSLRIVNEQYSLKKLSEDEICKRANEIVQNPKNIKDELNYQLKELIIDSGVCCFSELDDSILMWSHYAKKHSGVCLKFDMLKDLHFFTQPFKVEYAKNLPQFDYSEYRSNYNNRAGELVHHVYGIKHASWKYEKEVRIVKEKAMGAFQGQIPYDKQSLIEVIFGSKCSNENILMVTKLLKENGYSSKFFQMKLLNNDFKLKKIEIIKNTGASQ